MLHWYQDRTMTEYGQDKAVSEPTPSVPGEYDVAPAADNLPRILEYAGDIVEGARACWRIAWEPAQRELLEDIVEAAQGIEIRARDEMRRDE